MEIQKVMLAGKCTDTKKLRFPVLATPKLDGIRCFIHPTLGPVSRNFKPIPNAFAREWLKKNCASGWDGELMIRGEEFNGVTSGIMSREGTPDFYYAVFDWLIPGLQSQTYDARIRRLRAHEGEYSRAEFVLPVQIDTLEELDAYEAKCLEEGYEGVMVRDPFGPYLCGKSNRSTEKQGYLLKIKRFEDAEAEIVGAYEEVHNGNEVTINAVGEKERSSHKLNKTGKGTLGGFRCKLLSDPSIEFKVGSGFSAKQRAEFFRHGMEGHFNGAIIKFKHQPSGKKEKPRFPVFLGFRGLDDI